MLVKIGTPLKSNAVKVMMLGSGELGKEVVIEFQRYGVEVIAVDKYADAPAMQVAHRNYVISMQDKDALRKIIVDEKPTYIVPEVEAINTDLLVELEKEGFNVVPCAKATKLTMNREGIRRLAAEELGVATSRYYFASNFNDFRKYVYDIGFPCVVKPVMSSSGKGQSVVKSEEDIKASWEYALSGARGASDTVIIEEFIRFDYEITLLTVSHVGGISFCLPIGHRQEKGDYQESWQPHQMSEIAYKKSCDIAEKVVKALGGRGIFGVELFIKGDDVYFSEVSPRPHDTGMVTMISQDLTEFALHVRAILGLPIPNIKQHGPSASAVILVHGDSDNVAFDISIDALAQNDTQLRFFGKPDVKGERRMGVALARGSTIDEARVKAQEIVSEVKICL